MKYLLVNVRSTVTARPMDLEYIASHEIAFGSIEQLVFDNIPNVQAVNPDGTPANQMAAHLVAADVTKRVGTAIMLRTMPGDRFTINVKGYYEGTYNHENTVSGSEVLESLMTTLMGGSTYLGVPVSELSDNQKMVSEILGNPGLASSIEQLPVTDEDPLAPRAYLNYLFFDDNMQLRPEHSGRVQVKANTGSSGNWQLMTASTTGGHISCSNCPPGTLLVYIDNQSIGQDVWFDDLFLGHYTSEVLEENHYYPFGLTMTDAGGLTTRQPYKYQSKELEKSFGLEIYDFHARMIDPQLGKTWQPDPHADLYPTISPYASMNNSPSNYVDPNGKDARVGMQQDDKGNTTVTISSTIYVTGYNQKEKTADYNQFLKDNPDMLSNTVKNEDGTTTTTKIEMNYVEATTEDIARVTNEETRNGDNLMFIGPDKSRSSATFIDNKVTNPLTGEVTKEKITSFKARMGGMDAHYGSSKTAFHETMHLFGLRDWYNTVEDRYKVGFHDMMNNHTSTNTKPVMHQTHWNSWGKAAQDQQKQSGSNNFILNRPVETE